jgi:hypothetical protein
VPPLAPCIACPDSQSIRSVAFRCDCIVPLRVTLSFATADLSTFNATQFARELAYGLFVPLSQVSLSDVLPGSVVVLLEVHPSLEATALPTMQARRMLDDLLAQTVVFSAGEYSVVTATLPYVPEDNDRSVTLLAIIIVGSVVLAAALIGAAFTCRSYRLRQVRVNAYTIERTPHGFLPAWTLATRGEELGTGGSQTHEGTAALRRVWKCLCMCAPHQLH